MFLQTTFQVPSGFYLADALLWADALLGKGLLVPGEDETKVSCAGTEAKRLKKLLGALRYLFRSSGLQRKSIIQRLSWLQLISQAPRKIGTCNQLSFFKHKSQGDTSYDENVAKLKSYLQKSPKKPEALADASKDLLKTH